MICVLTYERLFFVGIGDYQFAHFASRLLYAVWSSVSLSLARLMRISYRTTAHCPPVHTPGKYCPVPSVDEIPPNVVGCTHVVSGAMLPEKAEVD